MRSLTGPDHAIARDRVSRRCKSLRTCAEPSAPLTRGVRERRGTKAARRLR